ncbi:MAG: peptidoglycan-binding protein [Saprospiraceae bacterium]|nr:peptidoglycan-binding protein [Saprospiraceae bacterium]
MGLLDGMDTNIIKSAVEKEAKRLNYNLTDLVVTEAPFIGILVAGNIDSEEGKSAIESAVSTMSAKMGKKIGCNLNLVAKKEEPQPRNVVQEEEQKEEAAQTYTVVRGDTFWGLAERFYGDGTKHPIISAANNTDSLHAGDVLTIPPLSAFADAEKLQLMLTAVGFDTKGIDGVIGKNTVVALRSFQEANNLNTSAVPDVATKQALHSGLSSVRKLNGKSIQILLRDAGFNPGKVDGILGGNTKKAVKAFQEANGLAADGIAGPNTISKLVQTYA